MEQNIISRHLDSPIKVEPKARVKVSLYTENNEVGEAQPFNPPYLNIENTQKVSEYSVVSAKAVQLSPLEDDRGHNVDRRRQARMKRR